MHTICGINTEYEYLHNFTCNKELVVFMVCLQKYDHSICEINKMANEMKQSQDLKRISRKNACCIRQNVPTKIYAMYECKACPENLDFV